jgi:PAS domain S-box-containing protein
VAQEESSALDGGRATAGIATGDCGEALRVSEQRFRQEFGRMPAGMLMTSLAANRLNSYLAVNDTFCELTGYSRRELGRGDFLGNFHPEDQPVLEALIQGVISGRTGQIQADARLVRKDGEIVFVHLTGSAILPPAGERYLTTFIEDTTAAESARAEIRRLEHELQRSRRLESAGQLVGGIAHDFNNLLTVIANYASLVRDEVSVAEATESSTRWEPVRWDVEQIEDAADRARRLVKHMLAFARREEGQPVVVDFGQLINDVGRLLREMLGEHIPLVTRQGAGLWPVEADPGLLEQVIMNITVNARDAMPTGGRVTIETANIDTVNLAADRPDAADLAELLPGRYVELRITDSGAGMDTVTAERAFEPFFTTKNGDQAAGLGLSAVSRLAARAGGRAWLRSQPGRGTTVTVILPAAPGSGSGAASPAAADHTMVIEHVGTVLVVDDEAAIRDVTHRVLTSAGYRVMMAASGQEALDLLRNPGMPADLLLADVVMPGMTGKDFAARVQAIRPGIRMLFMSGYERPGADAESWPAPGTQVIGKPFSRAALLARVTQLLAEDIGRDQVEQPEQPERLVRVRRR